MIATLFDTDHLHWLIVVDLKQAEVRYMRRQFESHGQTIGPVVEFVSRESPELFQHQRCPWAVGLELQEPSRQKWRHGRPDFHPLVFHRMNAVDQRIIANFLSSPP